MTADFAPLTMWLEKFTDVFDFAVTDFLFERKETVGQAHVGCAWQLIVEGSGPFGPRPYGRVSAFGSPGQKLLGPAPTGLMCSPGSLSCPMGVAVATGAN